MQKRRAWTSPRKEWDQNRGQQTSAAGASAPTWSVFVYSSESIGHLTNPYWGTLTQDPSDPTLLCAESEVRAPRLHSGVKAFECQRVSGTFLGPCSWLPLGHREKRKLRESERAPDISPAPVPLPPSKALLTWDAPPYGCPKGGKAIAAGRPGTSLSLSCAQLS